MKIDKQCQSLAEEKCSLGSGLSEQGEGNAQGLQELKRYIISLLTAS
jgi:hypothetical protein